jgi:monoamine oxidase
MRQPKTEILKVIKRAHQKSLFTPSISRRKFLEVSTKFSVGSLVLPHLHGCIKRDAQIAIIGAGIAGLTTAHYLKRAGIKTQIYEASNRVGGRVITAHNLLSPNITTEVGGEFIDSTHIDLLEICKEFNLPLLDMQSPSEEGLKTDFFFENRRISEDEIIKELSPFSNRIKADSSLFENDPIFKNPATVALDQLSIDEYLSKIGISGWLSNVLKTSYTSELGLESGNQSCLNLLVMLDTNYSDKFEIYGDSDERYKVKGGNEAIIKALSRDKQEEINLGYKLERIGKQGEKFILSFENGQQLKVDFAIITLPFSVLRDVKIEVDMPPKKRNCIEQLGYGEQSKLFIGIEDKLWRKQGFTGYLLSDKLHNGWDSSQMQNDNKSFGGYSFFVGGDRGKNLSIEQLQHYLDEFDKVYPHIKSQYLGKSGCYNWAKNPYSKGAYACYKVGQTSSIGGAEFTPVGKLFFAGEHCSKEFQGYMNGSVETAKKVVASLINILS